MSARDDRLREELDGRGDAVRADLHRRYLAARKRADREAIWQEILLNDRREQRAALEADR